MLFLEVPCAQSVVMYIEPILVHHKENNISHARDTIISSEFVIVLVATEEVCMNLMQDLMMKNMLLTQYLLI